MSLQSCLTAAGKTISKQDREFIERRYEEALKAGRQPVEAAQIAVELTYTDAVREADMVVRTAVGLGVPTSLDVVPEQSDDAVSEQQAPDTEGIEVSEPTDEDTNVAEVARATPMQFAKMVWERLIRAPSIWRTPEVPITATHPLDAVKASGMPNVDYRGSDTSGNGDDRVIEHLFELPASRDADGESRKPSFSIKVYPEAKAVEIDVLRVGQGRWGKFVYNAAAGVARANGYVFRADRAGFSEIAAVRRTTAMLAAAMRYGVQYVEPDLKQETPTSATRGLVTPLQWDRSQGASEANVMSLLATEAANVEKAIPEVADYSYDITAGQFAKNGTPITDARFERDIENMVRRGRETYAERGFGQQDGEGGAVASPYPFGRASIARAIVTRSMARITGTQARLAALEIAGNVGAFDLRGGSEHLTALFSKRQPAQPVFPAQPSRRDLRSGENEWRRGAAERRDGRTAPQSTETRLKYSQGAGSPADVQGTKSQRRAEVVATLAWGSAVPALVRRGILKFVSKSEAEALLPGQDITGVKGIYVNGVAYVVWDATSEAEIPGVVLHEVGVHYGIKDLVGARLFDMIMRRMRNGRDGDADIAKAWDAVPADTSDEVHGEEALAYLTEQTPGHGLVTRVTDAIKGGLNRLGFDLKAFESDTDLLRRLARESLRHASRGRVDAMLRMAQGDVRVDSLTDEEPEADGRAKPMFTARKDVNAKLDEIDGGKPKLSKRVYSPEQIDAMSKASMAPDNRTTLRKAIDGAREFVDDLAASVMWQGDYFIQSVFDRHHGLKVATERRANELRRALPHEGINPYVLARFTASLPSVMEAVLLHGAPEWDRGVLQRKFDSKGLIQILEPVQDDLDAWLGWMVGRRAARLKTQGKEVAMTDDDIKALLSLPTDTDEQATWEDVAREYVELKESILDVAEQAGIIGPADRDAWDHVEYLPFFRVNEATGMIDMPRTTRSGIASMRSPIRTLRGGKANIADPLQNIIQNWTVLLDRSLKNAAMQAAVRWLGVEGDNLAWMDHGNKNRNAPPGGYFKKVPLVGGRAMIPMREVVNTLLKSGVTSQQIAVMPPEALAGVRNMMSLKVPQTPDVVSVMYVDEMGRARAKYLRVEDPLLLRALVSFTPREWNLGIRMLIAPLSFAKRVLTIGVTRSPVFMSNNFIRDALNTWLINEDKMTPMLAAIKGAHRSYWQTGGAVDLMFGGGSFVGGYVSGTDPKAAAKTVRRVLSAKGITGAKANLFQKTIYSLERITKAPWRAWEEVGSAIENASREAIYEAAYRAQPANRARAVFLARDILDFSMRGDNALIQLMTEVVPFFNARLQGMYKLYRAGGLDRGTLVKHVALRGAAMAIASTALYAMNALLFGDAWEDINDWEKDTYWHIAPGTPYHIRIPKPFEVGLIFGSIPERIAALLDGQLQGGAEGDQLRDTVDFMWRSLVNTLMVNPIAQGVLPVVEVSSNFDTFSGRPIENLGDTVIGSPALRYEWYTSPTARELSALIPNSLQRWLGQGDPSGGISPKDVEQLWRGYFGTLGGYVLSMSDVAINLMNDSPTNPKDMADYLASFRPRDIPLIGAFWRGDSPPTSTRYVDDFYQMLDDVTGTVQTIKEYQRIEREERSRGNAEAAEDALEEYTEEVDRIGGMLGARRARVSKAGKPLAKEGYVFTGAQEFTKMRNRLSDYRRDVMMLANEPNVPLATKVEKIDDVIKRRNEEVKRFVIDMRARQKQFQLRAD
jgi:hypothetical protein